MRAVGEPLWSLEAGGFLHLCRWVIDLLSHSPGY